MTLERQLRLARAVRAAAPGLAGGRKRLQLAAAFAAASRRRRAPRRHDRLRRTGPRRARASICCRRSFWRTAGWKRAPPAWFASPVRNWRAKAKPSGCVLRDPEVYGPIYRQMRRFDADHLLAGAARCHLCEAAPCVAASPTRTDIPAFIAGLPETATRRAPTKSSARATRCPN